MGKIASIRQALRRRARPGLCGSLLALAVLAALAAACSRDDSASPEPPLTSLVAPPVTLAQVIDDAVPDTTTTTTSTTIAMSQEWTMLAGGDVLMDRTESAGINPFTLLDPPLHSADLATVNVEMVISDRGLPLDKAFVFRAPLSAAARIRAGGVDVANLANNHAKDYGPDALLDTVGWLEAAGVATVGAGATVEDAHRPRLMTTGGGVRVAFVGASQVVPSSFAAGATIPGIASAHPPRRSRVLDSVRAASAEADAVIVSVHWGIERDTCPSPEQRSLARDLLDAGADAVIGHHPHVLQPVEFDGRRLVAYSLGNFVWHPRSAHTGETGVLQIDFDGGEIIDWSFHPHLIGGDGAPAPVTSGGRFQRIRDIIGGDCARHTPPPTTTTTTLPPGETTLPPPTGTAGLP